MRRKTRLPRTLLIGAIACGTLAVGMTGVASAKPGNGEANRTYVCVAANGEVRANTGENVTCESGAGKGNVAKARADATSTAEAKAGIDSTDDRNRATAVATNGSFGTIATATGTGEEACAVNGERNTNEGC